MGSGQIYVERLPVAALDVLVRTVWIQQIGLEPYQQRNLPTGGVELHCPVGSLPRLVGPLTGPSADPLAPGTTLVGVRFRPGVAAAVFGLPASELVDLTLSSGPRRCRGPCGSRASWRSPGPRACARRHRTTAAWPGWPPRPATPTTPT